MDKVIIGIAGLPAAGKAIFGKFAKQKGFQIIVMGDFIREECKKRNLPPNRINSDKIMIKLREEKGENIVAQFTVKQAQKYLKQNKKKLLIDGIRSTTEVEYIKNVFLDLKVVGIHSNTKNRHERAKMRARTDDGKSDQQLQYRDDLELSVGIGSVIATADYLLVAPNSLELAEKLYLSFLNDILK